MVSSMCLSAIIGCKGIRKVRIVLQPPLGPPTVPDSPDGEDGKTNTQMASQAEHNEMELDKEKKRKSDEASSETHAAKLSKKQQPFELVECGGGGACGFNSIAVGMA